MNVTASDRDSSERDSSDFLFSECDSSVQETAGLASPAFVTAAVCAFSVLDSGVWDAIVRDSQQHLGGRYELLSTSGECGVRDRSDCKPHYVAEVLPVMLANPAKFARV